MRVWIDERACVGNGVCEELSPEVFVMVGDIAKVRGAGVRPGLENAVLAGCGTTPGVGIPPVLRSAIIARKPSSWKRCVTTMSRKAPVCS